MFTLEEKLDIVSNPDTLFKMVEDAGPLLDEQKELLNELKHFVKGQTYVIAEQSKMLTREQRNSIVTKLLDELLEGLAGE